MFLTARYLVYVWLTQSVNHTMPGPKICIPRFVMVNRAPVTLLTIVKDRLQSTLSYVSFKQPFYRIGP